MLGRRLPRHVQAVAESRTDLKSEVQVCDQLWLATQTDLKSEVLCDQGAVQIVAECKTNLKSEIHVTGGVDDVDEVLVPSASSGGRSDGDASLLLLSHPVHGGPSLVHLPNLVCFASVEEDTLCTCRLQHTREFRSANVTSVTVCEQLSHFRR